MNRLQFSTSINAPREKVWQTLWDDATYRQWTSVFSEGSHAVTDWQEGSKVLFLDGKNDGMYSKVQKRVDNEFMAFKHLGEVKKGKEQAASFEAQGWGDAVEQYSLQEEGGKTQLVAEMDTTPDFADYFTDTFPKALEKVKQLAEA